jgi:hypothetical protein
MWNISIRQFESIRPSLTKHEKGAHRRADFAFQESALKGRAKNGTPNKQAADWWMKLLNVLAKILSQRYNIVPSEANVDGFIKGALLLVPTAINLFATTKSLFGKNMTQVCYNMKNPDFLAQTASMKLSELKNRDYACFIRLDASGDYPRKVSGNKLTLKLWAAILLLAFLPVFRLE